MGQPLRTEVVLVCHWYACLHFWQRCIHAIFSNWSLTAIEKTVRTEIKFVSLNLLRQRNTSVNSQKNSSPFLGLGHLLWENHRRLRMADLCVFPLHISTLSLEKVRNKTILWNYHIYIFCQTSCIFVWGAHSDYIFLTISYSSTWSPTKCFFFRESKRMIWTMNL